MSALVNESFPKDDIGAEAAKLNTNAQMCSNEVLARFEPMIIQLS